ncbi:triphosphoribosyl-dephospho-CoA synthase CitG [Tropicimonas sp. TH_r6]|uniref:triphosphoribosyl-dephospho-CoA synthase CitG n=1 Tax=Tropicimonas sp. TH_r6 TaxID=3082085 RepID=UPI0029550D48|nr:triphosphoribosyl-dephospho-CoA synthase CitG [Tropicimonas sp. TH_r6]MDV7143177.1 triphosphoribosyl-dephospho-CoA synthase CitG [Tropicimonas sp. TH_r6]
MSALTQISPAASALPETPVAAPRPLDVASLADLAHEALLREVWLTPKPGLVDLRNTGSHADMDVALFEASAAAIAPFFPLFIEAGQADAALPAPATLPELRRLGLHCETAMLHATKGVNTHKGAIFAFGLALGAAGRLVAREAALEPVALCREVAAIAAGLVARDLAGHHRTARTAGELAFHRHGLPGARGEAQSGFATIRMAGLPAFRTARASGRSEGDALRSALVALLAENKDTNLISRGGPDGLAYVRQEAARLRAENLHRFALTARLEALDDAFIARNLSPGGTADLVGLTWFLAALGSRPPDQRNG